MSVSALLLLSCMHSLGLGLDLGNSLDRRERTSAHTRIAELPKTKQRLILNDALMEVGLLVISSQSDPLQHSENGQCIFNFIH